MAAITYLGEAGLKALIAKCKALAWEIEVVSSLPTTGEARILYLLKTDATAAESGNNVFDEYIWADGAWEKLGSATLEIDLKDYAKQSDLDDLRGDVESLSDQVGKLTDEVESIDLSNFVESVSASGSGELTLSASKSGSTVAITGSVDLSDYQKSADLTEITASDVETMWDEA